MAGKQPETDGEETRKSPESLIHNVAVIQRLPSV